MQARVSGVDRLRPATTHTEAFVFRFLSDKSTYIAYCKWVRMARTTPASAIRVPLANRRA